MGGLARHGSYLPLSDVQALVATMDTTGSGVLDYEEFLAATVHFSKTMSEEILFEAFAELDADGTGFITAEDIAAKLTQLGTVEVSEAEVLRMIGEADLNDDGMIGAYFSGAGTPLRPCLSMTHLLLVRLACPKRNTSCLTCRPRSFSIITDYLEFIHLMAPGARSCHFGSTFRRVERQELRGQYVPLILTV